MTILLSYDYLTIYILHILNIYSYIYILCGSNSDLGNYRPISVLPCFSKILEKIMCNRLYKHLSDSNILYRKQFGFQEKHLTKHSIMQLIDQINCSSEKNLYKLGILLNFQKLSILSTIKF